MVNPHEWIGNRCRQSCRLMSFLNCLVRLYLARGRTVVEMALKALLRWNAPALNPNSELGHALAAFRTSPSASSPRPLLHFMEERE